MADALRAVLCVSAGIGVLMLAGCVIAWIAVSLVRVLVPVCLPMGCG